jgi:hypothetical protein
MIVHQTKGVDLVTELIQARLQIRQELCFVGIGKKDLLTGIAAGDDMIKRTGIFDP